MNDFLVTWFTDSNSYLNVIGLYIHELLFCAWQDWSSNVWNSVCMLINREHYSILNY